MNISQTMGRLGAFLLAACLSGCAHQSEIGMTSTKLNAYHADIKRLLFVTELGETLKYRVGDPEAVFESNLTDALHRCGIATQFHKHDPLALQNEEQLAVKSFSPDTILELRWKSSQTRYGVPISSVLMGTMIDWKTKQQVWKAEINLVPAYYSGETLAASIIQRLKTESILGPTCPTPIVPRV